MEKVAVHYTYPVDVVHELVADMGCLGVVAPSHHRKRLIDPLNVLGGDLAARQRVTQTSERFLVILDIFGCEPASVEIPGREREVNAEGLSSSALSSLKAVQCARCTKHAANACERQSCYLLREQQRELDGDPKRYEAWGKEEGGWELQGFHSEGNVGGGDAMVE